MRWFEALAQLTQQKTPLVLVTLAQARGHTPREAGAKMLVTADAVYATVGGGNLEATAVELARRMLKEGAVAPQMHTLRLTENAPAQYGVQCCGGEVVLLLEPVRPARPTVAVFGVGHVGLALAQVLSICPIELHLVDARAPMLEPTRFSGLSSEALLHLHPAPIPELVVEALPDGSHLLVMTHDHAEDLAVLEAALRRGGFGFMGLIGSSAKWSNFQRKLRQQGFGPELIERITCPIGLQGIHSKAPQAIAVAVAAQLMPLLLPAEARSSKPVS